MTTDLRVLTWVVLGIPAVMAVGASSAPAPVSLVLWGTTAFMVVIYASVWLVWRPSAFVVGPDELAIRFPLRSRTIDLRGASPAEIVERRTFRDRYGLGMRVGAGGLWGGFGLLVTRRETFAMYISRTDRFVLIRPAQGRALILTPADPEAFLEAVNAARG